MNTEATLKGFVAEPRENADTDGQFAGRTPLACRVLIETEVDAIAAMPTTFRIH